MSLRWGSERERLLLIEQADAWFEYLDACQSAGPRYDEMEKWYWSRLQARLKKIGARQRGRRMVAA